MTKPTIRELLSEEWADKPDLADMLAERVEAVLRLHHKSEWKTLSGTKAMRCSCGSSWPCDTVLALEGEIQ